MALSKVCASSVGKTGIGSCDINNDLAPIAGIILATDEQFFTTIPNFATEAVWDTDLKAEKLFPIPGFMEVEPVDVEEKYYESPSGQMMLMQKGKYRARYKFQVPVCMYSELALFSGNKMKLYYYDENGNILGTNPTGTVVQGFDIQMINVENRTRPTPDKPSFVVIYIAEKNSIQANEDLIVVKPTWDVSLKTGIIGVTITKTALTILGGIINVRATCGYDSAGAPVTIGIAGLVTADFVWLTALGAAQTPALASDNGDGSYTWTDTDLATGTVNLKATSALADDTILIKSSGALSFTI